jgi:peptidoglycan hydrolase CwlO-like protein
MRWASIFLLCLSGISTTSASDALAGTGSPVERIVKLLQTLKEKTTNTGKAEQQIYDKYACWCETTSTRKANDIVQAQEDLRSLGQRILKLKGKIATRTAEIAELTQNIQDNEEEQEHLTAVREKQNKAWMEESAEVKQALAALQDAIAVLAKATTPQKGAALIQSAQQLMSKNAIKSLIDVLPSKVGLPQKHLVLLSEFVSAKAGYAPQSATIQGMLGDMYLTFSNNLESSTLDEANQNADFEKMYASLEKENNKFKKTRARKETEKAEAEAMLADTTKAYDDTEKQMKADMEFFDQTKAACQSKHEEWTVRVEMRDAELAGIDKALEILTSDEARELFAKSIKPGVETFLQIASSPSLLQDSASAPAARAYNAVKAQVKKSHSIRLAALAVQIRTTKAGHFDEVIKAIDEMIKTLQEEGADDLAKKTQCLDEYQEITKTVKDLDWKIKNNEAKIAKLEKLIELRTKEREETIEKIKETKKYMKDITDERKEENEAYLQAKKDDEDAKALLEKAKEEFTKFYKENGIKMGPIQGSVKGLLQEEPEFERSADDAPDATFTHKGSNKLEGKGIVSLFDYIIEDLQDELANEKKAEAKSQEEYEAEMATAQKLVDDLEEKKVTLEGIIAKRKEDKEEENKDMKANNKDRDAELAYQVKIKPDCDWILKAFDQRAAARAAEMDGLATAKEFLAGKTALIEKSDKFDDAKLRNLGFLHMPH